MAQIVQKDKWGRVHFLHESRDKWDQINGFVFISTRGRCLAQKVSARDRGTCGQVSWIETKGTTDKRGIIGPDPFSSAIRRFSEDIDVTYDIRAFAPDLVAGSSDEALPPSRSQEKKWTRTIRHRLTEWVRDQARPVVEEGLTRAGFAAEVRADADCLFIHYDPLFEGTDFMRPEVKVEFGARSTGEPHRTHPVLCDAAPHLPDIAFPEVSLQQCWRSGLSGRRRLPFMFSATRKDAGENVCQDTGTILHDSMKQASWRAHSLTMNTHFRLPVTRQYSSPRMMLVASGLTIRQRSPAVCGLYLPAQRMRYLPTITRGCWLTACCLMKTNLSIH